MKMKTMHDVRYGEKKLESYDIYLPDQTGFRSIICFHGGGIESGDKSGKSYVALSERLCSDGYGVFQVNYSLYPDTHFPEFIEEAAHAVRVIKDSLPDLGGNGEILLYGQSAGAYMALMLCMNPVYLEKENISVTEITGWVIDSAQTSSHFNVIHYEKGLDSRAQRIDEYAPLYYIDDKTAFSRMLMICYEEDMPCRPEQNALFVKAVQYFNPEARIELVKLPGKHCHGSSVPDEDGEFGVYKEIARWEKNFIS